MGNDTDAARGRGMHILMRISPAFQTTAAPPGEVFIDRPCINALWLATTFRLRMTAALLPTWSHDEATELDPRDAFYPSSAVVLDDKTALQYIERNWAERQYPFRNVASAAAFSGRVVLLRRVLELGWPAVYVEPGGHALHLLTHVLSNWHCTPSEICSMIDVLVEHGADVDRVINRGDKKLTVLDQVAEDLEYLTSGQTTSDKHQIESMVATLTAARDCLLRHSARGTAQ